MEALDSLIAMVLSKVLHCYVQGCKQRIFVISPFLCELPWPTFNGTIYKCIILNVVEKERIGQKDEGKNEGMYEGKDKRTDEVAKKRMMKMKESDDDVAFTADCDPL